MTAIGEIEAPMEAAEPSRHEYLHYPSNRAPLLGLLVAVSIAPGCLIEADSPALPSPDGGVRYVDGGIVPIDGGISWIDGGVTDGGVVQLDGGVRYIDGGITDVDGGVLRIDGGLISIDGGVMRLDGGVMLIDGGVATIDGGVTLIDGGLATIDGGVMPIDGGVAIIDGGTPTPMDYAASAHTAGECAAAGGSMVTVTGDPSGTELCRFDQHSCPPGWALSVWRAWAPLGPNAAGCSETFSLAAPCTVVTCQHLNGCGRCMDCGEVPAVPWGMAAAPLSCSWGPCANSCDGVNDCNTSQGTPPPGGPSTNTIRSQVGCY